MRPLLPRVREVKHHAVEQDALLSLSLSFSNAPVPAAPQQRFLEPGGVYRVDDLLHKIRFASATRREGKGGQFFRQPEQTGNEQQPFVGGVGSVLRGNKSRPPSNGWPFAECT